MIETFLNPSLKSTILILIEIEPLVVATGIQAVRKTLLPEISQA